MLTLDLQFDTQPLSIAAREKKGVVYTKPWVVELMLDLAGYRPDDDLISKVAIEPAAGDGAFLVPMARRLVQSCRLHGKELADSGDALVAFELDSESARAARHTVQRALLNDGVEGGVAECLAESWITVADFLTNPAPRCRSADFVIGNPPYIRLEEIDPTLSAHYRSEYPTMRGRADIYIAFFEAALRRLRPGGTCAFICADRWMLNQYGSELRRMITASFSVETVIEMHQANAFHEEVDAYPAITVIRRRPQGPVVVAKADAAAELTPPIGLAKALSAIRAVQNGECNIQGISAATVPAWFSGTEPWPCTAPDRLALLQRLCKEFPAIDHPASGITVGIGVATGADSVYITVDPDLVEPSRLLPLAMAADTNSGELKWSGHYLVDPWDEQGLVHLQLYPRLAAYLESNRDRLADRNVGKKQPDHWYRTIDRVTHAIVKTPRIYIPDIRGVLAPVLDTGPTYPHHNLYFMCSKVWNMRALGGLLLSEVGQFFMECYGVRMRGGYLRFQAQFLRRIRVPRLDSISIEDVSALADAFDRRDRKSATSIAFRIYGIDRIP